MNQNNTQSICPNECLNTAQAAYELQIATGTLQNWRSLGIGPKFIKHRRNIYYLKSELKAYIDKNFKSHRSTSEYRG